MTKAELVSNGKLVRIHGRNSQAKRMKKWQTKPGVWLVPAEIACQKGWFKQHHIPAIPDAICALATRKPREVSSEPMPFPGLYTYQENALRHIIGSLQGRCLLADEMGLGKTRQAIAFMAHYGTPSLVICPAFLQHNWLHELDLLNVEATVMSFDSVRKSPPMLQWKSIVVDEAHYIKDRHAQRTQAIIPLLHECDKVLLCTGTPCPSRPEELFTLLHALRPSIVPSFAQFAVRYCNARKTRFTQFDTSGASNKEELAWLMRRAFMVRRLKKDMLSELPPKIQQPIYIECSPDFINTIDELQEKFEDALDNQSGHDAKCAISELFRVTCDAKLKSAVEYVTSRVKKSTGGCIVVFAHHQKMLDAMQTALNGISFVRIDGKTSMAARADAVQKIQSGDAEAALLSMGAAGVGLTMTSCNQVIFAELPWTPSTLRQCEDRVHRIGQKVTCHITYLLCSNTLDSRVWKKLYEKEKTTSKVLI